MSKPNPRPAWAIQRAQEWTPVDRLARDFPQLIAWDTSTRAVRAVLARLRADQGDAP
ncbi:hypothetical protein [Catellatospora sp. NPDC049133]|jgi:hypothetical protein|uniref:hypothetical protein n=1 Tax=Catellatospora sp. NPDC049133 TaxID=3155499 RepID=UPI0033C3465F